MAEFAKDPAKICLGLLVLEVWVHDTIVSSFWSCHEVGSSLGWEFIVMEGYRSRAVQITTGSKRGWVFVFDMGPH